MHLGAISALGSLADYCSFYLLRSQKVPPFSPETGWCWSASKSFRLEPKGELTSGGSALHEGHEVPNLDEVSLLLNLAILVQLGIFAHGEEQLVLRVNHLFNVERLVMNHERVGRVVYYHVLGQE